MKRDLTYAEVAQALRVGAGGQLFWLVNSNPRARAGSVAGSIDRQGYVDLQYRGVRMLGHRVVWLLTYGEWPSAMLDHIDGDRSNNDPSNLRICTNSQNQSNRKAVGQTQFKGVTWHRQAKRFQAQCGKRYLGLYKDAEQAARAYDDEARRVYGSYARLNFGSAA